jgi:AcrR family transcriptional regulator
MKVARQLFAHKGYADTSIEDLIDKIGLTRGALYHHFRDKKDLFRAVWEHALREAGANIVAAASGGADLWDQMKRGREAFLDSWTNPALYRILLIDGPSVLSIEEQREIKASMGPQFGDGALLKDSLERLNAGSVGRVSIKALTTVLGGAFDAAALAIATAEDKAKARREIGAALNVVIDGVRALAAASSKAKP